MQDKIENLINEAIGEDCIPPYNADPKRPIKHVYQNQGYIQALADLRSKTPELAKKIMGVVVDDIENHIKTTINEEATEMSDFYIGKLNALKDISENYK